MSSDIPILDSHIHLWTALSLPTLAWDPPDSLNKELSLDQYIQATTLPPNLKGLIYLETDRQHDLTSPDASSGYLHPLSELTFLKDLIHGTISSPPHPHAHLIKAIVPWAPLPLGASALSEYVEAAKEVAGPEIWRLVKGFRYLVQGKGKGVQVEEKFVESLRWCGKEGFAVEVGVDGHRDGVACWEEVERSVLMAHDGVEDGERCMFVLNHLGKPDMTLSPTTIQANPKFTSWRTAMYNLSRLPNFYIKLSGAFTEMSPKWAGSNDELFEDLQPWLAVVLAAFGPEKIMFGSDWPVCGNGAVKMEEAWRRWVWVVGRMCDLGGLGVEEQKMVWSQTAMKAYGIEELK